MASASARLLFLAGLRVVVLERGEPWAVRRRVSFAEAVRTGEAFVEGVAGRRVEASALASALARGDAVPVLVDPDALCLATLSPDVLLDARMAKANLGTRRGQAPLVIGLGPGFVAGEDVDAVVETQRGPELGRVIWSGSAQADTSVPAPVLGYGEERVLRSPRDGRFAARAALGALVAAGDVVGAVEGEPVLARVGGRLRGLMGEGAIVSTGMKVGDVDPRGAAVDEARISDKARAIAAGVLEAVLLRARGLA